MLFYNWSKIFRVADGKSLEIYRILKMLVNKEVPKSKYDPIYYYSMKDFRGMSFLLHPDVLLHNAYKYITKDVAIYAGIASIRPYADYLGHRTLTLPIRCCPVQLGDHMKDKELITTDSEGNLHFLYEQPPISQIN
jgi:hypothetical protein